MMPATTTAPSPNLEQAIRMVLTIVPALIEKRAPTPGEFATVKRQTISYALTHARREAGSKATEARRDRD